MSLMSKLLMSAAVATVSLSANANLDANKSKDTNKSVETKKAVETASKPAQKEITVEGVNKQDLINYVKNVVVRNPQVNVKGVTIIETKTDAKLPGWKILLTTMDLEFKGKEIHAPEMMFLKDGVITADLVDLNSSESYRKNIKPSLPDTYYKESHLIFGDKDAAHKILIFSDPQCPFCQDVVPKIFAAAKENPKKIAVYYYHLPLLRLHPVSDVLTRVMHVAQTEKKLEIMEKMYSLKINPRETNVTKILKAVNEHADYNITVEKIEDKEVVEALKADADDAGRMMVSGTPTIYIDGKWDKERDGYKALIK